MKSVVALLLLGCISSALCQGYGMAGYGNMGGGAHGGGGVRVSGGGAAVSGGGGGFRVSGGGAAVSGGGGGFRVSGGGGAASGGSGGFRVSGGGGAVSGGGASTATSAFRAAGLQGFGGGAIDVNNFGNIDTSAFGIDSFGNLYINVEAFDFNRWRNDAAAQAPRQAVNAAQTEQIVIGSRYRSGYARQQEQSSSERTGSGSGEAGIELSASRQASQDATQQYSQTASGEGKTEQGAAYGYQRTPNLQFQAVKLDDLPVHAGSRSQLPASARRNGYGN